MSMVPLTPDTNQQQALTPVNILAADDPRHGTVAGYNAHLRADFPLCGSCRLAKRRYEKCRMMAGGHTKVPALGTQRRIQALRSLGHSLRDIAFAAGYGEAHSALKYMLTAETMTAATARRMDNAYEQLCMKLADGPRASRVRNHAARMGWPPPLAWDDIDDPDEQPTNWRHEGVDRHADLDDMVANGFHLSEVTRSLGLSVEALEKWCDRNGRREDFNRLMARERGVA